MHTIMPREKLAAEGVSALTDAELLAILLGTGAGRQTVIELAGQLLIGFGGLRGLLQAPRESLERQHGLGPAKSSKLRGRSLRSTSKSSGLRFLLLASRFSFMVVASFQFYFG